MQRVKSSPRRSWFITERITVFTDFSFEKLRSADADVTGTGRRVTIGFLIDRDTFGGMLPQKFFDFLRLRNAISCILQQFKRNINFINSDTMTIILYCSFPPILRLRITNIFGRTSLIRCIIKKCLCSIVVIFGRWPTLLLLGYLCTHTASHFLRHCRARIMLLYIERTIQSVIELELD